MAGYKLYFLDTKGSENSENLKKGRGYMLLADVIQKWLNSLYFSIYDDFPKAESLILLYLMFKIVQHVHVHTYVGVNYHSSMFRITVQS